MAKAIDFPAHLLQRAMPQSANLVTGSHPNTSLQLFATSTTSQSAANRSAASKSAAKISTLELPQDDRGDLLIPDADIPVQFVQSSTLGFSLIQAHNHTAKRYFRPSLDAVSQSPLTGSPLLDSFIHKQSQNAKQSNTDQRNALLQAHSTTLKPHQRKQQAVKQNAIRQNAIRQNAIRQKAANTNSANPETSQPYTVQSHPTPETSAPETLTPKTLTPTNQKLVQKAAEPSADRPTDTHHTSAQALQTKILQTKALQAQAEIGGLIDLDDSLLFGGKQNTSDKAINSLDETTRQNTLHSQTAVLDHLSQEAAKFTVPPPQQGLYRYDTLEAENDIPQTEQRQSILDASHFQLEQFSPEKNKTITDDNPLTTNNPGAGNPSLLPSPTQPQDQRTAGQRTTARSHEADTVQALNDQIQLLTKKVDQLGQKLTQLERPMP